MSFPLASPEQFSLRFKKSLSGRIRPYVLALVGTTGSRALPGRGAWHMPGRLAIRVRRALGALGEQFDHCHSGDESADVGPDGDAAEVASGLGRGQGRGSGKKLQEKPFAEHDPGRQVDHKNKEPGQHTSPGIQQEIGAQYSGDRAAGADGWECSSADKSQPGCSWPAIRR